MFKDKIYEEMDDVEKIFEPFACAVNDELSRFPDKIEISYKHLFQEDDWPGSRASLTDIVTETAKNLNLFEVASSAYNLVDDKFFEFQFENLGEDEVPTINGSTGVMSHKLNVVKIKIAYDETELETQRLETLNRIITHKLWAPRDISKPRLNEIADIYGAKEVKADRSGRGKVVKFVEHINEMVKEKTLDIRDMGLHLKFIDWIILYVRDGNLAALNNLTRVKIITHQKRPIYSIEEKSTT